MFLSKVRSPVAEKSRTSTLIQKKNKAVGEKILETLGNITNKISNSETEFGCLIAKELSA